MKTLTKIAAAATLIMSGSAFAGIDGSAHDFVGGDYDNTASDQICVYCHTPHNSKTVGTLPLWNRNASAATFTMYTSATIADGLIAGTPGAESLSCLGCHDGTISVDQVANAPGSGTWAGTGSKVTGYALVSTDLRNDHPIALTYTPETGQIDTIANAQADGIEFYGTSTNVLECASCHDVHNGTAFNAMLRTTDAGSAICLACHLK